MTDETVSEMLTDGDEGGPSISRRAAIAAGIGAGASAFILLPATKSARAEVTAEELIADGDELISHDGSVDSIDVDPVIAVAWEGFNTESTNAEVEITFDTATETELAPYLETITLSGTNGAETFDYGAKDLLTEGWSAETFEADDNDSEASTEVTAEVTVEASEEDVLVSVSDSFTVTVVNHPAAVNVGGEIQTTIESDEQVDGE